MVLVDLDELLDLEVDEVVVVEGEENSFATEADSERWDCRSWRAEMEDVRESWRDCRRVVRVSRCADCWGPEVDIGSGWEVDVLGARGVAVGIAWGG